MSLAPEGCEGRENVFLNLLQPRNGLISDFSFSHSFFERRGFIAFRPWPGSSSERNLFFCLIFLLVVSILMTFLLQSLLFVYFLCDMCRFNVSQDRM